MLRLFDVDKTNWMQIRSLSVGEDQEGFLDSALGILARGYVYRANRARVIGIADGETAVGVALVKDLDEEPACYDLQQFLIDRRFQGRGYGGAALGLLLGMLAQERAYPSVEVCVHRENDAALALFRRAGFLDTGYVDEAAPDCLNLRYTFAAD
jgi:RimJ/RimL family protein N-acetyltransferase